MSNFLTQIEMKKLVEKGSHHSNIATNTQDILDSGAIPRLKEYIVQPGKVSDSIFGGGGGFIDKTTGERIEFENPPLDTKKRVPLRMMVRTPRISTHDISRGEIPFKDQVLAVNHNHMRKLVCHVIGTSQFDIPGLLDNSIVIGAENLKQIPFENVLRAYMAKSTTSTSLYQHFIRGGRKFCGHTLPDNLIPNGPLPYVMNTPSTKSEKHDESVSPETLIRRGIVTKKQYTQIRNSSLVAFGIVSQFLREKGLILVDAKTEHGINRLGEIVSQDELYTMDSSRFWFQDDYQQQVKKLERKEIEELNPKSYSKEFARGFSEGEQGYTDEQRVQIAMRDIEGIQSLTETRFAPDTRTYEERVISGLERVVEELVD